AVVVRDIHPAGHTRVPRYVRGKRGIVVHVAPPFSFPDAAAHGRTHRTEHTYHVELSASGIWADAASGADTVVVDLWDCYLEPASRAVGAPGRACEGARGRAVGEAPRPRRVSRPHDECRRVVEPAERCARRRPRVV